MHALGIGLGLGAALANALQTLLVRKGTEEGRASDAVVVVMLVNVVVLLPTVAIVHYPDYGLTPTSLLSFAAAGIFGTMLGRALTYDSIGRIGVSRTVPVIAGNALVATLLGAVVLGESLRRLHGLGIVLIVLGVGAIALETSQENPDSLAPGERRWSLLIPVFAAVAYGWEPIFANFGFAAGTPATVGLVVKTIAATVGFLAYLRWQEALPAAGTIDVESTKWFLLAGVANTLFLLGYYIALTIAPVNLVVPLIVTNTLWAVALSALVMPERLERVTRRLAAAALVVVAGVAIVSVVG